MKAKKCPFQDLTTSVLPGEEWRDIQSFECYYQVSNLGRVRSLDREIPHPRLKKQFVKGRILKQKVVLDKHLLGDEPMASLQVTLFKENKGRYLNVRRLVYHAFVKKIDLAKDGMYVINKDCDGYNNAVENLELVTKSAKSRRAFERNRVPESHLQMKYRKNWKVSSYGAVANRKPIEKIDIETGKVLDSYESITEAYEKNKLDGKEIINTAKGRRPDYGGFIWRYKTKG